MPRRNAIPEPPAIVERPDGTEAEDGEFALLPEEPESVKDAFYHPNPRLTAEKEPVDDPEDDIVIPAERAVAIMPQHHVVTGMAALAALPEEEFKAKLAVMKAGQERVRIIQRELMEDGEDYGKVSGVDRPFLHQPGAEKLGNFYGLASRHEVERVVGARKRVTVGEVTTDSDEWASPPLTYIARTYVHVGDFEGPIVAEGRGECNSWEDKYRYRWSKSQCPQCGHDLMKGGANGKMAGKWFCPGFKGGCWWSVSVTATNEDGTPVVKPPVRIDNPDPFGAAETLLQMAVKRCLSGTTPLLMKLSGRQTGIIEADLSYAYQRWQKGREVWLPTVGGSWTRVKGIVQMDPAPTVKITLADGQVFTASPDHRWPTSDGLLETRDLQPGMSLTQVRPDLSTNGDVASPEWGWAVGLFLADGNFTAQEGIARYTLNDSTKAEYPERLRRLAATVGSTTHVTQQGHTVRVQINGPFIDVIRRFMDGTHGKDRRPSPQAWRQGLPFISAVVDGYLDGDGSARASRATTSRSGWGKPRWTIAFTRQNDRLAEFLRKSAACLGYRLALREGMGSLNGKPYPVWRGWLVKEVPTTHPMDLMEIISVDPGRSIPTYDVEVEDPEHVFAIGGGVLTHNSFVAAIRRATGTSGLFTQDDDVMRSMQGDDDGEPAEPVVEAAPIGITVQPGAKVEGQTQVQFDRLRVLFAEKELTPEKIADVLGRLFGTEIAEPNGASVSAAVRALNGEQTGRLIQTIETGEITEVASA